MATHWRNCWNCKTTNFHESDVTPGVCCPHCGSQDTRRCQPPKSERQRSADRTLKRRSLIRLPLSFEDVAKIYSSYDPSSAYPSGKIAIHSLCESHERLRAELQGAATLLNDLSQKIS